MFSLSFTLHFLILFWAMSAQTIPPQKPLQFPQSMYTWVEDDEYFDCIVGIDIAGKPVGMGVFIAHRIIISSATPLHQKGWTKGHGDIPDAELEVYAISGAWDKSKRLYVDLVTGNQLQRNWRWVKVGTDSKHTTIFDVFIITLKLIAAYYYPPHLVHLKQPREPWFPNYYYGRPSTYNHRLYNPMGWKWAAFAFLDITHINESVRLAAKYYTYERPLEDCDEWIPRPWGHFICLRNDDNYIGIQNGAALFNGNQLLGLGAFELNKGNESILVFTDLLLYKHSINIRFTTTTTTTTTTAAPTIQTTAPKATKRWKKKKKEWWESG